MWSDLAIPIRAELSASIFSKAMRKKDCKEAPKELEKIEEEAEPTSNGHSNASINGSAGKKPDPKKKDAHEKDDKKPVTEQGVINLIAVSTRIRDHPTS